MELKKITAIINGSVLEAVEQRLTEIGVKGFSESNVTGRGEYTNLYRADLNAPHIKMEIFTEKDKVEGIVTAIMETAHRGTPPTMWPCSRHTSLRACRRGQGRRR